ncbi:MAG: tetratricopeptide repeat protein, partial [Pseudobdellovibrionaceae bacterium]|nr:tetratricopeptide repeat protein [Pseudobdellovibrionaceae bacterium]
MLKTCLLILVFLATDMVAQSRPVSIASNFDDLYFALQDDPAAMKKWAEVQIKKLGPGMDLEHAKMVATYAAACLELRCPPDSPLNAPKSLMVALQSAKRFQDATLIIRLEILILRMGIENKETKVVEKEYERILSLAKDLGSSRLQGEVLREMSALVERTDNLPLALRQIQQALVLSTKDAQPDDLIPIIIQHDAAIHFRRVNETDRAKELYQNVLNFAKKHKIRYFTGTSLLNFARSKISSNDPASIREADLLLVEAEKLMTGVDVAEPMAYINLSRGDIAYKRKSFAEALSFFDKALVIYKQINAQIWIADVHHWRAITLYEMGRFPEALDADKQAEEIFPKNFTTDHHRLALSKGKILHKMRLFEESIQELYRALKLKDDMIKEFSAKNLDRLKVELQVRSKEQQNELLKLDNALKEKELEHALFIRWIAIALLGLSALSLYLFHKSHRQARRLNRAQTEIQKILDNIEEGIISIKRDRHVETSLSPYINELLHLDGLKNGDFFGQVLSQLNIPQYEKDLVPEVINTCIGENRLTWDLNSHQLPIEAHMNDGSSRVLSLRWKCIFTDDDLVDQIILVMRDETVRKSLELNLVMEREVNQRSLERLLELAGQNPAQLNRFFQRVDQNIAQAVKNILPQKKWAEFMQGVHTIKGEARTLGL